MLENIHIQNFRCFEDFKMEGFERINLIGGKNNSGKTCLLEGLYLANCGSKFEFDDFFRARKSNLDNLVDDKECYTNLRYQGNNQNDVVFTFNYKSNKLQRVISRVGISTINLLEGDPFRKFDSESKFIINKFKSLPNIEEISIQYSKIDRAGKTAKINNAIQIIDPKILELKTYPDTSLLYVKHRLNEKPLPINYFGDAVVNMLRYAIAFAEFESGVNILLIDEIENGLHYTAHEEFWQHIFKLSKELNVQVFATTHSLEMIKAFNAVAKEQGEGAYFEMSREYETQNIFAFKHDTDLLTYELSKEDTTIRG